MTKPHEETWIAVGHRVETPGGKIEPTVNPPDREPLICVLIAQAPAMARLLLECEDALYELISRDDAFGARDADTQVQATRDRITAVLRAAGVLP